MKRVLLSGLLGLCFASLADTIPPGGDRLAFTRPFEEWKAGGSSEATMTVRPRLTSGQPFDNTLSIQIHDRTSSEYSQQVSGQIKNQILEDDVLLLSFYARCDQSEDESGLGRFTVTGRAMHGTRYLFPFTRICMPDREWQQFLIPFSAPIDNARGYRITFKFGGVKPQRIEIGGLEVRNYGKAIAMKDLPRTEAYYKGMEADAAWRKAAAARIEQHRKADLNVRVVDADGNPVPNAAVHAVLKRHSYGFGAAVGLNQMFSRKDPVLAKQYQNAVRDLFNKAVFENRMKWKFYRDGDEQLERAIDWFAENNIPLRGHCMVWPAWKRLPKKMQAYQDAPDEFRAVIEQHVRKMATVYPDTFAEWDVVNELYSQHEFVDLYGRDVVADWFRIAKEANPEFTTYINDYAILAGHDTEHQNNYHEWIAYLLKEGAPLEGVGFQGHFRAPVPPEEIYERMERFAKFGLEMQITEFDFEETDEELQARFTRDFMTIVFSHPQTVGIMTWCLWEKSAWKPSAAFFRADWQKKPIAQTWEQLIKDEWHTDASMHTDAEGRAQIRGFLGEYLITVNGKSVSREGLYVLEKEPDVFEIVLK